MAKKQPPPTPEQDLANWHGAEALRPLLMPVASLKPDPRNARLHPERSYEVIASSFRQFGQRKPIVVDGDGVVVAGNGQLEAAKRLGWTHIAVADTAGLSPEQVRAFALADNRSAELSGWDFDVLKIDLVDMSELGFTEIGWLPKDLEHITKPKRESDVRAHSREVDIDGVTFDHRCPRCGMEFDDEKKKP